MSKRSTLSKTSGDVASEAPGEPYLFLALDGNHPKQPTSRHRLGQVTEILIGRGREREVVRKRDGGVDKLLLRFPDPWMSTKHARIQRRDKGPVVSDLDSKNGTYVNGSKQKSAVLTDGDLLQFGRTFFVYRDALLSPPDEPLDATSDMDAPPGLLTVLTPLAQSFVAFAQAAVTDVPLVIVGERGTGKNVLAHSAHVLSGRTGKFVSVRVAGMTEDELVHKLCGQTRDQPGAIAEARGGTLLIDGIESVPAKVQASLLRILDQREGAREDQEPVPVDCRFMITSGHGLDDLVTRGILDRDLVRLLSGFDLIVPPLRQRREDLGVLVASMLEHFAPDSDILFTSEAAHALFCYPWPRNVRELESCLATALALSDSKTIDVPHLPPELQRPFQAVRDSGGDTLDTIELTEQDLKKRAEIIAVLRARTGELVANPDALIKARSQFQSWLARRKLDQSKS